MELIALIVFIEKVGDAYSAYSANLPGITVTGQTREEVEQQMINRIVSYIDDLKERHLGARKPMTIAPGPLEQVMRCVGTSTSTGWQRTKPGQCLVDADKEGLCWQHWRDIYGHAVDRGHMTRCDVCGQTDPNVLRRWESPCPGKARNPEWRAQLKELRGSAAASERARRKEAKIAELIRKDEEGAQWRPAPKKYKMPPPPSPHDAISRDDFLRLSGLTSPQLNKMLKDGQVDGVKIVGRMFFSRRQLEKLQKSN